MYKFSSSSETALRSAHEDLQKILRLGLQRSRVDFGISEGHRSPEKQLEYYKKGRKLVGEKWVITNQKKVITDCDGDIKKSKHNYLPSMAVDIFAHVPGKPSLTYDTNHLSYIAGILQSVAQELLARNEISHHLIWGNNWDDDGELIYDHDLKDGPHFELRTI